jgi:2-keto-4-pentenoate hydratase/2-oxohepta-3-ene-1,7-dioic acid hydratase in catechol pathway
MMRLANVKGRAALVVGEEVVDVGTASGGAIGPDLRDAFDQWDAVRALAMAGPAPTGPLVESDLGCPVPAPRQVFGIGMNYAGHAAEAGLALPSVPATFTKFPVSLAGPFDDVALVVDSVDWEVELVAVVGARADRVAEADGWAHIAGLTVGQDLSDRTLQFAAGGQFSLGKSRPGYAPMGPWVVTPDELADPDDLPLGCSVDGEVVQQDRTSDLVFSVPRLVAELSAVLPLLPGDVIFTGTPAGVGFTRTPPRFLRPGNLLETWIDGIGTIRNRCT